MRPIYLAPESIFLPPNSEPCQQEETGTHILGEVGLALGLKTWIGLQQAEMQVKGIQVNEHAEVGRPR